MVLSPAGSQKSSWPRTTGSLREVNPYILSTRRHPVYRQLHPLQDLLHALNVTGLAIERRLRLLDGSRDTDLHLFEDGGSVFQPRNAPIIVVRRGGRLSTQSCRSLALNGSEPGPTT